MSEAKTESDTEFEYRRESLLSRFKGQAGRHGPAATVKRATSVRLPKAIDLRAELLARSLGTKKATLLTQAITILTACQPARYYAAITAFQRASGGALKLPDWFELDDSEGSDYEALDESDSPDPAPAARRVRD